MSTRAYRPEVRDCLEDRRLLSGMASLKAHPVVLPNRELSFALERIREEFQLFAEDRDVSDLRERLRDYAVIIPFGRVDGLGVSINRILDRMQDELSGHVPHAIRSAQHDVIAVIRADVKARVRAGDVVVR